jgi:hypothetical protein
MTTTPLDGTSATDEGALNAATERLAPSENEATPVPAIVVTAPSFVNFRIRLFEPSARMKSPFLSVAIPWGEENRAAAPRPSINPLLPPASVETEAKFVIAPTTSAAAPGEATP